jgi:Kef-type K+ transport system membrane component KefB
MSGLSTSHTVLYVLVDLALIVIVARVVGTLFTRVGQPRVVGEIVAGVLLGPTLLGPALWPDFSAPDWMRCTDALAGAAMPESPTSCLFPPGSRPAIGAIGQLGLLLYMFLTGLGFDLRSIRNRLAATTAVGAGTVLVPATAGLAIGPLLATPNFKPATASTLGFSLFVGAMLAVTALPVMARILEEKSLQHSQLGIVAVGAAAVCTVMMFTVSAAASGISRGESPNDAFLRIAGTVAFLASMAWLLPLVLRRMARTYEDHPAPFSGYVAASLIVMFGSGYIAHELGLTVIVGGFVAGLVMPARERLHGGLNGRLGNITRSVLLPVFLAYSGLATDFTGVSSNALGGIAAFLVAGIATKWAGGAAIARLAGFSWHEGNVLGVLVNCRGLLVLVVALQGLDAGVITHRMQAGAVILALITTGMTGPIFDRLIGVGGPARRQVPG